MPSDDDGVVVAHIDVHEVRSDLEGIMRRLDCSAGVAGMPGCQICRGTGHVMSTAMTMGASDIPSTLAYVQLDWFRVWCPLAI